MLCSTFYLIFLNGITIKLIYAINIYLQVFHIRNRCVCNVHAFYEFPIKTKASENLKLNKVDLRKYLYYYYNIHKNRSHNGMQ